MHIKGIMAPNKLLALHILLLPFSFSYFWQLLFVKFFPIPTTIYMVILSQNIISMVFGIVKRMCGLRPCSDFGSAIS
jgi:hypothetical protein